MSYRVNLGEIRGMDPLTLEITVQDSLRRPVRGLSAASLADLLCLAETPGLSGGLSRSLQQFSARIASELGDLPPRDLVDLTRELDGLSHARVPSTLRSGLLASSERDGLGPAQQEVQDILISWTDTEPLAFSLGGNAPRVARGAAPKRVDTHYAGKRVAGRGEPATRRKRATTAPSSRKLDLGRSNDLDRDKHVEKSIIERLARNTGSGLLESVLIAGVVHGARATYPELGDHLVREALKRLEGRGRARLSAGRWSLVERR